MSPTFIKAAEIWMPAGDGSLLEFHAGAFGPAKRMAAISRSMCFGRGEGLPGHAWDEAVPILLRQFDGSYFRRTAAAHAAGLTCAIALPQLAGTVVRAVLILYCGHDAAQPGALELWRHDPDAGADMKLVEGAYGAHGAAFESVSRQTVLARGVGLPGLAWQHGAAVFLEELAADPVRFVRAKQAQSEGLQRGLAIPLQSARSGFEVATFLAGPELPLAQRVERWTPDEARTGLRRSYAFSELHGGRSTLEPELPLAPPASSPPGSIVGAWSSGLPQINEFPADEPGAPAAAAASIGSTALLSIPVYRNGAVAEVLALYL